MIELPPFHGRVLESALSICHDHRLYLAGGYAVKAYGLVERPSQDLDFATDSPRPLQEIIGLAADAFRGRGFDIVIVRGSPRMGRVEVHDRATGEMCEVDFLKEPLQKAPVEIGPLIVVAMDDLAGMKASALAQRALPRDFIDVCALSEFIPLREIERLAKLRSDEDFQTFALVHRLESVTDIAMEEFTGYGLDEERVRRLYCWAQAWADEIKQRRAADGDADRDWDPDIIDALYED